jgi:hypothetical protein
MGKYDGNRMARELAILTQEPHKLCGGGVGFDVEAQTFHDSKILGPNKCSPLGRSS